MKTRIPIKRYTRNPDLPLEEQYQALEKHHDEETKFLIGRIEELENERDLVANMIETNITLLKEALRR